MLTKDGQLRSFRLLATTTAFTVVALVAGLFLLARHEDSTERNREQALVANGLRQKVAELAHSTVPAVVWDDAVENLQNHFNAKWANDNIGIYFWQTDGFEQSWVLASDGKPMFGMAKGHLAPMAAFAPFAKAAGPLIDSVRQDALRAASGPGNDTKSSEQLSDAIQESGMIDVDGTIYVVTVNVVRPDFGQVTPKPGAPPMVLTAEAIDTDFLKTFASRFLLTNAHLHSEDTRNEAEEAHASLVNSSGAIIGTLDWSPQRPGSDLLKVAMAPILLVLLGLCLTARFFYSRGRRSTQSLVASEARSRHMALHDALTGLPNRLLFNDRLSHALQQMERNRLAVAVHCIDLDRFKDVNDALGHQCGDELLVEVAQRLVSICRATDTLARLGGDEFAIVQSGATATSAAALAERIVATLKGTLFLSAGQADLACSVGVTMIVQPGVPSVEAVRQADIALYRAKDEGRGRLCFFEPEMDAALRSRKVVERELRAAIGTDQLAMAYQPQVDGTGRIVGVEALMRWNQPTRGQISPAYFIPIAEECGLINTLGVFALETGFRDASRWPDLRVAINISAKQLKGPAFLSDIDSLILSTNIDPDRIELEITEGVLLQDDAGTYDILRALKHRGFSLALDDFGTGYSSLSYLRRYPIDKIKIDRSFITGLGVNTEADAVVSAIIKLAKALGLGVIAEGVETVEQRKHLRGAGCRDVQGFLTGKPMEAADLDELMRLSERQTA